MANMGDKLKKTLQDTVENVKEASKDIKMPEIKAPGIKNIKKPDIKLPEIKIPEQIKEIGKKKAEETVKEEPMGFVGISVENALKIIYCLMAVDGDIHENEIERLTMIGEGFAEGFTQVRDALVEECQKRISVESGVREYYDAIEQIVDDLLKPGTQGEYFMNPRLFLWDMLTIVYSDDKYDENEKKLISHIVKVMEIEEDVFLEMESSMATVMDIEKEIKWIKTTDRPYLKIEAVVNELEDRKNTILESIMELLVM